MFLGNICSMISIYLGEHNINNYFMIYVNACINLTFRALFFYAILQSKLSKKSIIGFGLGYFMFVGVDIYLNGIYMNEKLFLVSDLWVTVFCLISLNQIIRDDSLDSLSKLPIFWVLIGTLIYVVYDFMLTLCNAWLYAINREIFFIIWDYITPIFLMIKITLICIGLRMSKRHYFKNRKTQFY